MSLEVWLKSGRPVSIGGRDLILMPLPIAKLHSIGMKLRTRVAEQVGDIARKQEEAPDPATFISDVIRSFDVPDMCFHLFADPKQPDGNPVNPSLTKDFFDQYIDLPTTRRIIVEFIKVNEIEETIKNLSSLPGVKSLIDSVVSTIGIGFLSSLRLNTNSPQTSLSVSPFLKSTATSGPIMTDTNQETSKETVQ